MVANGKADIAPTAADRPSAWAGDETGERRGRTDGGDGQDPYDDRAAQCRDAVGAVEWIAEDPQALLTRPPPGERIRRVGQAVLVERPGDQHARDDRDRGGDGHWDQLGEPGRESA